jgi:small-conductance mechanosensitive channel
VPILFPQRAAGCGSSLSITAFESLEITRLKDIATWLDQHNISLLAALGTIGLLIGAIALSYVVRRVFQDSLQRVTARLHLPYETVLTITRVLIGAVRIIAATLILEIWGVSVGGLWTLLVSAATVIGVGFLATWTMVSNITASFFIAIWRPFHLGDTVEILPENLKGRVVDSNLMFLVVRESGGSAIHIPNNLFFQKMFKVTGAKDRSLFEEFESGASQANFACATATSADAGRQGQPLESLALHRGK